MTLLERVQTARNRFIFLYIRGLYSKKHALPINTYMFRSFQDLNIPKDGDKFVDDMDHPAMEVW